MIGGALGVLFAMLTGHAIASSLYGVKPLDVASYLLAVPPHFARLIAEGPTLVGEQQGDAPYC